MNDEAGEARPEDAIDPMLANVRPPTQQEKQWHEVEKAKQARASIFSGVIGLAVLAVCVFVFMTYFKFTAAQPDRDRARMKADVYQAVTNAVSARLKAPRSAIFCSVEELQDDGYYARGYVDSQNSFGAMIRAQFKAQYDRGLTLRVNTVEVDEAR